MAAASALGGRSSTAFGPGRLRRPTRSTTRLARQPRRAVITAGWRLDGKMDKQMDDHYATLMVPRGAKDAAIKEAYRRLQRRYHPDSSQGDAVRSAAINEAYRTLMDRNTRAQYDADLRRNGPPPTPVRDVEGLVGPLLESGVLLAEALPECGADACDVDGREDMIQFVRQWGATLPWSAELPLPLPLQCDEIANGCRLGFVTVRDGAVCLVGELRFTVAPAEEAVSAALQPDESGSPWLVTVRRQKFQLSGILAAALAGAIGGIPLMGSSDQRTYEQYHLKRAPVKATDSSAAAAPPPE